MPTAIYRYDPHSGEYLGTGEADISPRDPEVELTPGFATTEAPPEPGEGEVAVYEAGEWALVEDHRGEEVYAIADGAPSAIETLGPIPADKTAAPRPDGYRIWDATAEAWVFDAAQLGAYKAEAAQSVDDQAEAARLDFITGGSGQALVYESKRREAAECLANYAPESPPAGGVYPMLDAEVGITKTAGDVDTVDAYEVAEVVAALATAWSLAGAAIEAGRLGAKRSIAEAADSAAVDAIIAGLSWPSPV